MYTLCKRKPWLVLESMTVLKRYRNGRRGYTSNSDKKVRAKLLIMNFQAEDYRVTSREAFEYPTAIFRLSLKQLDDDDISLSIAKLIYNIVQAPPPELIPDYRDKINRYPLFSQRKAFFLR